MGMVLQNPPSPSMWWLVPPLGAFCLKLMPEIHLHHFCLDAKVTEISLGYFTDTYPYANIRNKNVPCQHIREEA